MAPPNRHLELTKTNYFANLKRKAKNPKDVKEQSTVNMEILNCIATQDSKITALEKMVFELIDRLDKTGEFDANIVAHIQAVEEAIGVEKVKEIFEKQQNSK